MENIPERPILDRQKEGRITSRPFSLYSIASQLRYGYVFSVVMAILVTGIIIIYLSYEAQLRQVEAAQQERSRAAAIEINAYKDDLQRKLSYLARVQGLTELSVDVQQSLLNGLVRHNNAYEALAIADKNGNIVIGVSPYGPLPWDNIAESPAFIRAYRQAEDYFGFVEIDPATQIPMVTISVPIRNQEDVVAGVLLAKVNLDFLWFIVSQTDVGETGYVYILDNRHHIIAEKGITPDAYQLNDVSDQTFIQNLIAGEINALTAYQGWRQVEVFGAIAKIPGINWFVVSELPTAEALAPIRQMLYVMLATLVPGIISAVVMGLYFSKIINTPLQRLTTAATLIQAGNLKTRVDIDSRNELGVLANAFNDMTDELDQLYTTFEQKVAQRTRELVQITEELTRSNEELVQFAYIASHDLQEPLRKVTAFGGRLQTKYGDALDDRGRDYLARMMNATERMQMLIQGLLNYSRVTTKANPFEPVDLNQIAQGVVSDLEIRIEKTGGQVTIGELPTLEADPLQIRQLLQNLIGNSLKFARPDVAPVVQIQAQRLNGQSAQNGNAANLCQISVTDNGIGFDEKYADRIFGVFQRLHGRNQYEGTGIGLAICKKIAERHGGDITARGVLGKGANFIITLPVKQISGDNQQ